MVTHYHDPRYRRRPGCCGGSKAATLKILDVWDDLSYHVVGGRINGHKSNDFKSIDQRSKMICRMLR